MRSQILAVQKMQDYIEAHLTEEITLATLADLCNFSPWYAHRLFREHTGYAPAEYVRRMRLAKSALRLKTEQTKIIDVAFDLGFASVDGYTRAFRKEFGINPGEYAKSPVPIKLFVAYGVKFKELRKEYSLMENANVFIQVIHKPRRSHRLFGYDGGRLADQHLGRIQTPYQDAAGGNDVLWSAGNSDGFGKQLLCVFGADGRLRSCADHGANSLYHTFAGKQYTGNVGASIRIVWCSLFQFFAHWHGCIRSAGRQNIHAIVDGGIWRSADLNGRGDVLG